MAARYQGIPLPFVSVDKTSCPYVVKISLSSWNWQWNQLENWLKALIIFVPSLKQPMAEKITFRRTGNQKQDDKIGTKNGRGFLINECYAVYLQNPYWMLTKIAIRCYFSWQLANQHWFTLNFNIATIDNKDSVTDVAWKETIWRKIHAKGQIKYCFYKLWQTLFARSLNNSSLFISSLRNPFQSDGILVEAVTLRRCPAPLLSRRDFFNESSLYMSHTMSIRLAFCSSWRI